MSKNKLLLQNFNFIYLFIIKRYITNEIRLVLTNKIVIMITSLLVILAIVKILLQKY